MVTRAQDLRLFSRNIEMQKVYGYINLKPWRFKTAPIYAQCVPFKKQPVPMSASLRAELKERLPMKKTKLLTLLFTAFVLVSAPTVSHAQMSDSKKALIEELLVVTNTKEMALMMGDHMITNMKAMAQNPNLSDAQFETIAKIVKEEFGKDIDTFLEMVVPVYDKHFSEAEIQELIAFYRTPIGKKAIDTMPKITNEIAPLSQQWAISIMPKVQSRIQAELK